MKIFLSAIEGQKEIPQIFAGKMKWNLMSYYAIRKNEIYQPPYDSKVSHTHGHRNDTSEGGNRESLQSLQYRHGLQHD